MLKQSETQCKGVCSFVMVFTRLTAIFIQKANVHHKCMNIVDCGCQTVAAMF